MTPRTVSQEQRGAATQDMPAVMESPRCPNCGRKSVVVFSVISFGEPVGEPERRVYLHCCPKIPADR